MTKRLNVILLTTLSLLSACGSTSVDDIKSNSILKIYTCQEVEKVQLLTRCGETIFKAKDGRYGALKFEINHYTKGKFEEIGNCVVFPVGAYIGDGDDNDIYKHSEHACWFEISGLSADQISEEKGLNEVPGCVNDTEC
jgi:hypothetical protein